MICGRPTPTRPPSIEWMERNSRRNCMCCTRTNPAHCSPWGVLYRLGAPSPVLQAMIDAVSGGGEASGFPLTAADFAPRSSGFYTYAGSKTTPPYQEPVEWVVMQDAGTVSREQVDALMALSGGPNNRPVQPLGERGIVLVGR